MGVKSYETGYSSAPGARQRRAFGGRNPGNAPWGRYAGCFALAAVNKGARVNRFTAHLPFLFATVQARIRGLGIQFYRPTVSRVHSPQGAASLRQEPVDSVRMLRHEPQALREILIVELGRELPRPPHPFRVYPFLLGNLA